MDPWTEAMRRGDFGSAWAISDHVLHERIGRGDICTHLPRHEQFVWNGEPLTGRRIFVRCYHGLGDTLQFVRLLAHPRLRAAEITLWVQPALIKLLQTVHGVDRILPLHEGNPGLDYDVDIEIMELPHALRLAVDELPGPMPYIYVPASAIRAAASRRRRIGVCWSAGEWDPKRSLSTAELRYWGKLSDIRWFSLQFPPATCSLPAAPIASLDIAEMAARMQLLDLIITVDTMTAHLAGALGLPVWLLLPHDADWRWMLGRDDTPWYPTMRLFRQPMAGDWSTVIEQVHDELAHRVH
ncbi:ADP-heptose--LPS heptosyltransferase [Steroidobacter cummioxidans]|uniref:ADP-heptose--LPS heptosyltransferase n=1 Tax=Steroidobacter cummioxidans TaxID=1803913 RepID=UPI000E31CDE7|nr:ADP-heptose--LPS heptosyltransferase [Steroidobacter cummioxidans]